MIGRLAVRSLTAHPVRSAVLAAGFGDRRRRHGDPARRGADRARAVARAGARRRRRRADSAGPIRCPGGSCWRRRFSRTPCARASGRRRRRTRPRCFCCTTAAPRACRRAAGSRASNARSATRRHRASPGGATRRRTWPGRRTRPDKVLRHIDRFHPVPDAPEWAASWAEWLYFNGRATECALLPDLHGRTATARRRGAVRQRAPATRSRRRDARTSRATRIDHGRRRARRRPISRSATASSGSKACDTASTSISPDERGRRVRGRSDARGDRPAGWCRRSRSRARADGGRDTWCR